MSLNDYQHWMAICISENVNTISSISRLNKTILAHYSRFNKIATLGYIMAHEGMGTDHYSMSRLTMRRSPSSTGYCYILPVDEL